MERGDRAPVATFHAPALHGGIGDAAITLGEPVAHHARVKRLQEGDLLRLSNGSGGRALATIERIAKRSLEARLLPGSFEEIPAPPDVRLLLPVADRERMLWLAEKCAELALTRWCPVIYHRSRSVSPRGEGDAFREKVRVRMIAALEQSGGAWLPDVGQERSLHEALAGVESDAERWLLDADGQPVSAVPASSSPSGPAAKGLTIALGPEGGLEPFEREQFVAAGWRLVRLAPTILRFETAGIAALSVARALRDPAGP